VVIEDFDTDWSGVLDAARTMMAIAIGEEISIMDTFDAACRRADRKAASHINKNYSTPSTAIEAIKQAVRDRGIAALKEPATRDRLQRCDAAAHAALDRWLTDFIRASDAARISEPRT